MHSVIILIRNELLAVCLKFHKVLGDLLISIDVDFNLCSLRIVGKRLQAFLQLNKKF